MRKYYNQTIEKTLHCSKETLAEMVRCCFGNIGKPMKIEKNSEVEKFFLGLRAKKIKNFFEVKARRAET